MTRANPNLSEADLKEITRRQFAKALAEADDLRLRTWINFEAPADAIDLQSEQLDMARSNLRTNRLYGAEETIREIEAAEGISIPLGTPAHRKLAHLLTRADVEIKRIIFDRMCGDLDAGPEDPMFVDGQEPAPLPTPQDAEVKAKPPLTLTAIYAKYDAERGLPPKSKAKFDTAVRRFCDVNGDLPIAAITKAHVRDLKDALLKMPRTLTAAQRAMPIPEIVRAFEGNDAERLSAGSVNADIAALSAIFGWAQNNDYCATNPAHGIKVAEAKNVDKRRLPYDAADLARIFNSPVFRGRRSEHYSTKPGSMMLRNADYWLPLLALFAGARLEELGQLRASDVRHDDGVTYIDINTLDEGKSVKTRQSRRKVPLHPELVRCGFLAHVDERRKADSPLLFPDLKGDNKGHATGNWSKWWGRYARAIGITDGRKVFHSFRHGFKDACRAARIEEEVHDALTGHSDGGVGRSYGGNGVPLAVLSEAMAKITYKGLDLSHLHP